MNAFLLIEYDQDILFSSKRAESNRQCNILQGDILNTHKQSSEVYLHLLNINQLFLVINSQFSIRKSNKESLLSIEFAQC